MRTPSAIAPLVCLAALALAGAAGASGPRPHRVGYASQLFLVDRHGHARRLTDGRRGNQAPAWSPTGREIATRGGGGGFQILDRRGRVLRTLRVAGFVGPPVWSPDGQRLAFVDTGGPGPYGYRVVTMSARDGRHRHVLADDAGFPRWSPDGGTIYYVHVRRSTGQYESLWAVPSRGGASRELAGSVFGWYGVSPSGRWLYYDDGSDWRIIRADGSGKGRTLLHEAYGWLTGWAPPGLGVYYSPHPGARLRVVSTRGHVRVLGARPTGSAFLAWSPDTRWIAWLRSRYGKYVDVRASHPDGTGRRILARFTSKPPFTEVDALEWSPDGRRLVVEAHRHIGD